MQERMNPRPENTTKTDGLLAEFEWVRGFARRLARDVHSADDLAQGAITVALESPPAERRAVRPLLASIVRRLARHKRRAEARRAVRERLVARAEAVGPESSLLEEFEEQERVVRLVGALPPELRALVLRHYWKGESVSDIASATDTKPGTVRARLGRARRMLAEAHRRDLGERRSSFALATAAFASSSPFVTSILGTLFLMKTVTAVVSISVLLALAFVGFRAMDSGRHEPRADAGSPVVVDLEQAELASDLSTTAREDREREALEASAKDTPVEAVEAVPAPPGIGLRAIDEDGRPIAGARVHFVHRSGAPRDMSPSEPSGDDGRIELEVPRKATFAYVLDERRLAPLKLVAPGYAASFFTEGLAEAGLEELGDRVLERGSTVRGHVVDDAGIPAPNVVVAARGKDQTRSLPEGTFSMRGQPNAPSDDEFSLRTVTGADGSFELEGLALGEQVFWFQRSGEPWNQSEPVESIAGGVTEGLVLTLATIGAERLILGRVVDPDGNPTDRASVRYRRGGYWEDKKLPVSANGEFRLVVAPGGTASFAAFAKEEEFGPSITKTVGPGLEPVVLALSPARRLRVVVTDAEGQPLERAWMLPRIVNSAEKPKIASGESVPMSFENNDTTDSQGRNFARADADGVHELLAPAAPFQLRVGHRSCETVDLGPFDPDALPEELEVKLERYPALVGIVRSKDVPVEGARILLMREIRDYREVHKGFASRFFEQFGDKCFSDEKGRFARPTDDLGEDPLTLLVEAEGFARAEVPLGALSSVEEAGVIEVELTPGGRLEGRVTVATGASPEGVVIGISREDGRPYFTRTDARGDYAFEHLTPGAWRLEDRRNEPTGGSMSMHEASEVPFRPNIEIFEGETTNHDLDLAWQADARVRGRVLFDGVAQTGWTVLVEPGEDESQTFRPVPFEADGHFDSPTTPGPVVLLLRKEHGEELWRLRHEVIVEADTPSLELNVTMSRLEAEDLEPNAEVMISGRIDEVGSFRQWVRADDEGRLSIDVPSTHVRVSRKKRPGDRAVGDWMGIGHARLEGARSGTVEWYR